MKNFKKTMICILTVATCSASSAAILLAHNKVNAAASEDTPATQLLLPTSYEQYLHLNAPTDVAVNENFTAIADGNIIYVYDRAANVYREYTHNKNSDPSSNNVKKLQFDEKGNLYFLDAAYLYMLDLGTLDSDVPTVTNTSFPCSTFYLHEDMLYFTDMKAGSTPLYQLDLSANETIDRANAQSFSQINALYEHSITVYENELYYTSGSDLKKISLPADVETSTATTVAVFDEFTACSSIRIVDGVFCCTNSRQSFYAYDLEALATAKIINTSSIAPLAKRDGAFSALTVFDGEVYAVDGTSIRQFNAAAQDFTDYEICKNSSSQNRLGGASEIHLAGNLLLIADNGNHRISVYDRAAGEFLPAIENRLATDYLASDGQTVLAANEDQVILYSLKAETYGAELAQFNAFVGNIVGTAGVYGSYYLALDNYFHYHIATDENGTWFCKEIKREAKHSTPSLLTADAYGNLYLACGAKIYLYTEEQFLSETESGRELETSLSTLTQKIMVDYAGDIYALVEGKIFKLGNEGAYELNTPLVYAKSTQTTVTSFAFGIEENVTFALYEENYVAQTTLLNLPTVKTIAVNGADESIFAKESAEFSVVQTTPHALAVYFDIHALEGADIFPYQAFERRALPFTALKIGETATHNALAVFDEGTHDYQTCLVLKSQCTELPDEEYRLPCTIKEGYLSNAVSLYKFPYLTSLLTVSRLSADTKVTLLGEIDKLDHPYYHVEFTDENGTLQTGFIPKAYVTEFSGKPPQATEVTYGELSDNNDDMFRLAYMLLGAGVICILVDLLILRKRKDEDNEK